MQFTKLSTILAIIVSAAAPVVGASVDFTVQGTFATGGTLSGIVTIDTATGSVSGANFVAAIAQKFTFASNVATFPNSGTGGVFIITAYASAGGFPLAVIGLQVDSLVNYKGGPMVTGTGIFFTPNTPFAVTGGTFTLLSSNVVGGDTIAIFGASGAVAGGGTLGGTLTIDTTTGTILASNITGVIVRDFTVSADVTGTPNFSGTGLFVISADAPGGNLPLLLLGLPVSNLIGYTGGPISNMSNLNLLGQQFGLSSGSLIALTDVSGRVSITQNGYGRNRATGIWTATMSVTNTSGTPINGPVEVVLTNLPPGVTMVNFTGMRNGSPYITVSPGSLGVGATVSVPIQFTDTSGGLINFSPVTEGNLF